MDAWLIALLIALVFYLAVGATIGMRKAKRSSIDTTHTEKLWFFFFDTILWLPMFIFSVIWAACREG